MTAARQSDTLQEMARQLEDLLVDEAAVARDEIAEALRPYVRLTRAGELLPEPAFDQLPAEHRVLCVLLALQASHMLGLRPDGAAAPAEVVQASGMPAGTVRPKLSALLKSRYVVRTDHKYSLPVHATRRAVRVLRKGE